MTYPTSKEETFNLTQPLLSPSVAAQTLYGGGVWIGSLRDTITVADARQLRDWLNKALPDETSRELCPNCGKDEVGTFTADDSFLYGRGRDQYRLIAKDVLFFRCMACGLEYTGEDGEAKRMEAVRAHLARQSAQETEPPRITFPEDMPMSERIGDPRIDGKPEKASDERVCQCATYCMANAGMKWDPPVKCRGLTGTDPGAHVRFVNGRAEP